MPKRNIIMDSQILNAAQLCPFKLHLSFNLHLQPPQKAEPLERGDLLHQLFEFYYRVHKEKGPDLIYDKAVFDETISKAEQLGELKGVEMNLSAEEVTEVIYQFKENVKLHKNDGIEIVEVEKSFIVKLYEDEEIGIYYTGKIDLLCNYPNFGLTVMDHKSAKRDYPPDPLSNQFTGYAVAMDVPVVVVNKVGFQKTVEPERRFKRHFLNYTNSQKERWKKNTIWWAKQIIFYMEENTYPENRTSCDKYGGCQFVPICGAATDEGREFVMATQFIEGEPWDVTKHLRNENESS